MLEQSEQILERVKQEFDDSNEFIPPSVYSIYIHFMAKTGLILYDDRKIKHETLMDLIDHNVVKCEGIYFHQGEKCMRYRFYGFKYPEKFYRSISPKLKKIVLDRYDDKCNECGREYHLQIDHIFPWSKGGLTEVDNLQVLCKKCNYEKSNKC